MITTKLVSTKAAGSSALMIILITFVLAGAIVAVGRQPAPQAQPTPALRLPVIVVQKEREVHTEVRYIVVTATAEANTAPVRKNSYAHQQLPTATAWVADPQLVQQDGASTVRIDVPTDAPRYCATWDGDPNDWRVYDAHYGTSPACKP